MFLLLPVGSCWVSKAESHLLSSSWHLCLCLCLSQSWQADTKALFHPCSSSRGWHAGRETCSEWHFTADEQNEPVCTYLILTQGWSTGETEAIRVVLQKKPRNVLASCISSPAPLLNLEQLDCEVTVSSYRSVVSVGLSSVWSLLHCCLYLETLQHCGLMIMNSPFIAPVVFLALDVYSEYVGID